MKEDTTLMSSSTARESGFEDYNWVSDEKLPNETKLNFLDYPLNMWKDITLDQDFQGYHINDEGTYYQKVVNKILAKDIFKDLDFHKEENGVMDFKIADNYKIDYNLLTKKSINPDFLIYKIPKDNFFEILEERKYMMIMKYNIPDDKDYISIIGEIKTRTHSAHKNSYQRQGYLNFINLVNSSNQSNEFLIMMYIYDESFSLFKKELSTKEQDKFPFIYGYMPKLYYENCYKTYNVLSDLLGSSKKKIDISNKNIFKKKITKKQLLLKNEELEKELNLIKRKIDSNNNYFYFFIGLIIIIVSYLIGLQRGSSIHESNQTK